MFKMLDNTTTIPSQSFELATNVSHVEDASRFKEVSKRNIGAVILQRQMSVDFQQWLNALAPQHLPSLRKIVPVEKAAEAIAAAFERAGTPASANQDYLANDAIDLAKAFTSAMDVAHLRIRFDVINNNACRNFHLDQVTARLVCTYRGAGTQYKRAQPDTDPEQIFDVPTGSPIILRGASWQSDQKTGIVHRSPPIEGSGQTRLLYVLDPIKDPETEQ